MQAQKIWIKKVFLWFKGLYKLDLSLITIIMLLLIINAFVQYSANDRVMSRLISDVIYTGMSLTVLLVVAHLDLNHLKVIAKPLYLLSILLLVAVLFFGVTRHGAKRWLHLGIQIQPSELCKLSVPLILAYHFSLKHTALKYWDYFVGFILILIPFVFIVKQPDLGTGILVFTTGFFVIFFAGLPWRVIIFAFITFLCSTPVIWHALHPYQQHRIMTLLNPASDPLGKGYHVIQGIIAIGSGGLWGKGYLKGTQVHLNFIPEKSTDFVVTVLGEEFGFIGIAVVLCLYFLLIWRGLKIMQQAEGLFAKTLAGSITLSLTLYVLINMGMVAGILPVVGVPLPLISYGGTASIVLMFGFGILLAIAKQSRYDDKL